MAFVNCLPVGDLLRVRMKVQEGSNVRERSAFPVVLGRGPCPTWGHLLNNPWCVLGAWLECWPIAFPHFFLKAEFSAGKPETFGYSSEVMLNMFVHMLRAGQAIRPCVITHCQKQTVGVIKSTLQTQDNISSCPQDGHKIFQYLHTKKFFQGIVSPKQAENESPSIWMILISCYLHHAWSIYCLHVIRNVGDG